ncbi:hypothetical protein L2725_09810 [Shewanella corallii]|uniref:Uncharacterized protein n=1 Tax=Shewanella corallii TaxID=560080 RepID=A0ABT0N6K1_9GAMM|nr:hypothetical protein [Shewanella corallii]MCL2914081.1 hypothetical protein [Shewanella corallii]
MENHIELIKTITPEITKGLNVLSLKRDVAVILKDAHSRLSPAQFSDVLIVAQEAFSEHCGCADELEDLESILDDLHADGVIDSQIYQRIIENTACARWL